MTINFPDWCKDKENEIMLVKTREQDNLNEFLVLVLGDNFYDLDFPDHIDSISDRENGERYHIFKKSEYKSFYENLQEKSRWVEKLKFLNTNENGFPVDFFSVGDLVDSPNKGLDLKKPKSKSKIK